MQSNITSMSNKFNKIRQRSKSRRI